MRAMSHIKKKRISNPALLERVRANPCYVCLMPTTDAAHIKSKGSGGDDLAGNLISLCRIHHQEQHLKGWVYMFNTYWRLQRELKRKGWVVYENRLRERSKTNI